MMIITYNWEGMAQFDMRYDVVYCLCSLEGDFYVG
jgi:hypothetical protein